MQCNCPFVRGSEKSPEDGDVALLGRPDKDSGIQLVLVIFRKPGLVEPEKYNQDYICYHNDGNFHELPPDYIWCGLGDAVDLAKSLLVNQDELAEAQNEHAASDGE